MPLEEADKEDLADTLKRRISSSRSEAATCAAKGDSSRMSRFCLVLLLGGAARWEENGRVGHWAEGLDEGSWSP